MNLFRASTPIVLVASLAVAGLGYAQDVPLKSWAAPNYFRAQSTAAAPAETAGATGQTPRHGREALAAVKSLAATPSTLSLIAVTPCRVIDTRTSQAFPSPWGAPSLAGFPAERTFPIVGRCGIPAEAAAVSLNITVVDPAQAGNLSVFPAGATLTVSMLNWPAGMHAIANAAIVPLGVTGITVHPSAGVLDLIVDVNGYYAPGASGAFVSSANNVQGFDLDEFVSPSGTITPGSEDLNTMIVPTACTADFQVAVDTPTLGTLPITFTLRVKGVDTSVSCLLATDATSCASGAGAPLAAGDKVSLRVTGGNGTYGAAKTLWLSMRCQ